MATSLALVALLLQRLQVGDERSLHRRLEHEVHELREVLTPRPARAKHGRRVSPQLPLCHRARFVGDLNIARERGVTRGESRAALAGPATCEAHRQQLLHLCLRRLAQLLLRHHRVDHPEGERLAGRHERAELQHPLGLALADDVAEHRRELRQTRGRTRGALRMRLDPQPLGSGPAAVGQRAPPPPPPAPAATALASPSAPPPPPVCVRGAPTAARRGRGGPH
eukprot:2163931-Prymnesium_polylepis.1